MSILSINIDNSESSHLNLYLDSLTFSKSDLLNSPNEKKEILI